MSIRGFLIPWYAKVSANDYCNKRCALCLHFKRSHVSYHIQLFILQLTVNHWAIFLVNDNHACEMRKMMILTLIIFSIFLLVNLVIIRWIAVLHQSFMLLLSLWFMLNKIFKAKYSVGHMFNTVHEAVRCLSSKYCMLWILLDTYRNLYIPVCVASISIRQELGIWSPSTSSNIICSSSCQDFR